MTDYNNILIKNAVITCMVLAFTGLIRVGYNIVIANSFNGDTLGQVNLVLSIAMLFSAAVSIFN